MQWFFFSFLSCVSTGFPSGSDIYCCFPAKWLPAPQANVEVCCVEFGPFPGTQYCSREQRVKVQYRFCVFFSTFMSRNLMKLKRDRRCRSICSISHVWRKKVRKSHTVGGTKETHKSERREKCRGDAMKEEATNYSNCYIGRR